MASSKHSNIDEDVSAEFGKSLRTELCEILWQGYLGSWDAHIHCLIIQNDRKNPNKNHLLFLFFFLSKKGNAVFSLLYVTLPICAYPESGLGVLFIYCPS